MSRCGWYVGTNDVPVTPRRAAAVVFARHLDAPARTCPGRFTARGLQAFSQGRSRACRRPTLRTEAQGAVSRAGSWDDRTSETTRYRSAAGTRCPTTPSGEVNGTASAYAQGAASIARDVEEPSVVSGSGHWRVGGRYDGVADLFESAPTNMDMAFVVVHLAPKQVSHMDAVLQRTTGMPVHQVTSTVSIEKNHIYVIARGMQLEMSDGCLRCHSRDQSTMLRSRSITSFGRWRTSRSRRHRTTPSMRRCLGTRLPWRASISCCRRPTCRSGCSISGRVRAASNSKASNSRRRFYPGTNTPIAAIAIASVAIHPPHASAPLTANSPMTRLLLAISIITTMIGTALTPLMTALQ